MAKGIDLRNKYAVELQEIGKRLRRLEQGRVSELTGREADGALGDHARHLASMMADLFRKIEGDGRPAAEDLGKAISDILRKP